MCLSGRKSAKRLTGKKVHSEHWIFNCKVEVMQLQKRDFLDENLKSLKKMKILPQRLRKLISWTVDIAVFCLFLAQIPPQAFLLINA